jgi:protein-S-isoprenylcysteine O-methyltransferase Ste14
METGQNKTKPSCPAMLAKVYAFFLLTIAILFISAGRLSYWQGWLFCGIYFLFLVITSFNFADKKDLLAERLKPGPGVKWWDKIFFPFYLFFIAVLLIVSALDAGRFYWSPRLPVIVYAAAYVAMLASYSFILWAMWTNKFFSSRVRIQTDRGHYVIQQGPYRFVRHPGYLGMLFWLFSLPLTLGSLWGLIPAALSIIAIIIRTYLEDKTLQKELPGYADYAKKVRCRLIKGIW